MLTRLGDVLNKVIKHTEERDDLREVINKEILVHEQELDRVRLLRVTLLP